MDDALPLPQEMEACHALLAELTAQQAELSSRLHSQDTLVGEQSRTLGELHDSRERLVRILLI